MKTSTTNEQRVADILAKMRKAMPEIKRQVAVYEKNILAGIQSKQPTVIISRGNV